MRALSLFTIILIILCTKVWSQSDQLKYADEVYVEYIHTVVLEKENAPLSLAIIDLNSSAKLKLTFDDLEEGDVDYSYDIIHCNRFWEPSDLNEMDYIDGFTDIEIRKWDYSINTKTNYTRYTLLLPNEDTKITLSGNYLLVIYADGDKSKPIISKRFFVMDAQVGLKIQDRRPLENYKYDSHQEFDFTVDMRKKNYSDPLNNFSATVVQNNNWTEAIFNLHPKFINRDFLEFNYNGKVLFPALKEFRDFDARNLRAYGRNVNTISRDENGYNVLLELDKKRKNEKYFSSKDANGGFTAYTEEYPNPQLSAEYVNVLFSLEMEPIDEEVYVLGQFNNYLPNEACKMYYNNNHNIYNAKIFLKQGYYNYLYAVKKDNYMDYEVLEGSWYETENDYLILIYYSPINTRYDQLIGVSFHNSNR